MHKSSRPLLRLVSTLSTMCLTLGPARAQEAPKSVRFAAVLQPGCLLPSPNLLRQSPVQDALMSLQVDESGRVTASSFQTGTGRPDVDAALSAAASGCRFAPAYVVELSPVRRTYVPDEYQLHVRWPEQGPMVGSQRCLTPDYPHAARRAEESGLVTVLYRVSSTSGQIEVKLKDSSAPPKVLSQLSLSAVRDCLAHKDVAAEVPPDTWISAAFNWRLE